MFFFFLDDWKTKNFFVVNIEHINTKRDLNFFEKVSIFFLLLLFYFYFTDFHSFFFLFSDLSLQTKKKCFVILALIKKSSLVLQLLE
jgi:hypothetical protein